MASNGEHYQWMRRSVDLAKQSRPEALRVDHAPAVGVVIVSEGIEIASAFRGQCTPGGHAEYCALNSLDAEDVKRLAGATAYTTLEPCSRRNHPKVPCAQRLADAGVRTIFIGLYDPNPRIYREGWRILRDAGVELRDFPGDLRNELRELNHEFLDQYRLSRVERKDDLRFDHVLQRTFTIGPPTASVSIRWSTASTGACHAYTIPGHIALARYASAIEEIDDPAAMSFDPDVHAVTPSNGNVFVVLAEDERTFAIVKVTHVLDARYDDRNEILFSYEIRAAKASLV
jgi:pyrimidine deaminase RibD-like protein